MAEITAQQVKELRERTGAGMMDCKKALIECDGELEKAIDYLRQKGLAQAAKKAGRVAADGLVAAHVGDGDSYGALAEVNCETDFVAKGDEFRGFAQAVVRQVAETAPASVAALLAAPLAGTGETVEGALKGMIAKIGENQSIRRFTRYAAEGTGLVHSYIHGGGRVGVLIELGGGADAAAAHLAHELCLQVAALKAQFVRREDVPAETVEREREVYRQKALAEGKPAQVVDRIVDGQVAKFYKDNVLLEQPYVRDDKKTISQLVKEAGGNLVVRRFVRYEVGEGIEKGPDDFSGEIAKLIQ